MKKTFVAFTALAIAMTLSSCGDNKTKEKVVNGGIINATSSVGTGGTAATGGGTGTTTGSTATSALDKTAVSVVQGANMMTKQGAMLEAMSANGLSPLRAAISRAGMPLGGPDTDGWYTYSGVSGSTIKIRFHNAITTAISSATVISNIMGPAAAGMKTIEVDITTQYAFGTWHGYFLVDHTVSPEKMSGNITSPDPVGGSFTETMSNITMESYVLSGQTIGIPVSGTSSLVSHDGSYSGTFAYGKTGGVYTHTGTITAPVNGTPTTVATIYLTFNTTLGNYSGYFVDMDGASHNIQ